MPPADGFDALLDPLMAGAFEQPLWATFLARLRAITDAAYASLIFRPPPPLRLSVVHLAAGEQWPPLMQRLYREGLHEQDPVQYHDLREGRVYALSHLIDRTDPAHAAWLKFSESGGLTVGHTMRIVEPSGVNIWLSISRRGGAFADGHRVLIERLGPFLRHALRGFVALERERYERQVLSEATRRLNFGWLGLDAGARVLEADPHALDLLAQSGIAFGGRGTRLATGSAERDREIAEAVRAVTAGGGGRPRALVLARDPWLDMFVVAAGPGTRFAGPAPAAIGYVHGDACLSADRCEQLGELFGLTRSESRLALALARGMTIAEAAADMNLTIGTARGYSKAIYAKTGARGQPDIVRFILRSSIVIA